MENNTKTILVSGGAGYVGSVLVPKLIAQGYKVKVFDTFWFWKSPSEYVEKLGLQGNPFLTTLKGDLRNVEDVKKAVAGVETVIQLACISNDPSSDLDPDFTESINRGGNIRIIDEAKKSGVKRFIYASSSSVYGIKEEPNVTEDMELKPLTQYSELKIVVEKYLLKAIDDNFKGVIVRPSTVCGYSPRQRLDVVVNILTNFAVNKGKIKVFGGDQLRPNIHIDDMADVYIQLVEEDIDKVNGQTYNAGWDNLKVLEIAKLVKEVVGEVEIEIEPTDDNRSYHVSSQKIKEELGFVAKKSVKDAIFDLKNAFVEGKLIDIDDDRYYNLKLVKKLLGIKTENISPMNGHGKKAIVTGGAGFIGSHMVELLLENGYKVIAVDDMSNGQFDNVEIFRSNPNFEFRQIDLAKEFDDSFFGDTNYVFHMAALADIVPSINKPVKYHEANVTGTLRVLEACRKYNIKKIIYSASSSCYGIPDKYPTPETTEIKPMYPYALAKYVGEQYALFWNQLYDLPVISLRYFNVFGTRARTNNTYGAVFKVFLKQKLENKPLTIVGDGNQTRDFTYVTDIAKANLLAAESNISGEIINIGTGVPQSINYLAKLIGGQEYHTETIPKRPGEPESTHADTTKAKELLKWKPKISFEEGVKKMLENISYWKDAPLWTPENIEKETKDWFKYLGSDK